MRIFRTTNWYRRIVDPKWMRWGLREQSEQWVRLIRQLIQVIAGGMMTVHIWS